MAPGAGGACCGRGQRRGRRRGGIGGSERGRHGRWYRAGVRQRAGQRNRRAGSGATAAGGTGPGAGAAGLRCGTRVRAPALRARPVPAPGRPPRGGRRRGGAGLLAAAWRGGGAAVSSGSGAFSGGGGTPSAGLGVPTTIQLPAGSCTRCAVSRDGIMPSLRADSARAGAACASSTSRSSASFCCSSAWLVCLRAAQLIGPLGGVGGQPQRDAQPEPERADDQHHERHLGGQGARVEVDRRRDRMMIRSATVAGQPWAPWPFAPWRAPWPGWRSSAGPARRAAADRIGLRAPDARRTLLARRRAPAGRRVGAARRAGAASRAALIGAAHRSLARLAFMSRPFCRPTFSSARSRTDALRGLSSISSAPARSAPRVRRRIPARGRAIRPAGPAACAMRWRRRTGS